MPARRSGRAADALRPIVLEPMVSKYAEGSCLARFGDTHVLCTASIEDRVPPWLRGKGSGWITAEYGMLPRSTDERMDREAVRGKQSGRTQEIQRLIGRSLRSIANLKAMRDLLIKIDCDVLQADGGTRTAAVTGGYVALHLACRHLVDCRKLKESPLTDQVAAISCGIVHGQVLLDLDYGEDSNAGADSNFVLTGRGDIVEVQGTAEGAPFSRAQFDELMNLARKGCADLIRLQRQALVKAPA